MDLPPRRGFNLFDDITSIKCTVNAVDKKKEASRQVSSTVTSEAETKSPAFTRPPSRLNTPAAPLTGANKISVVDKSPKTFPHHAERQHFPSSERSPFPPPERKPMKQPELPHTPPAHLCTPGRSYHNANAKSYGYDNGSGAFARTSQKSAAPNFPAPEPRVRKTFVVPNAVVAEKNDWARTEHPAGDERHAVAVAIPQPTNLPEPRDSAVVPTEVASEAKNDLMESRVAPQGDTSDVRRVVSPAVVQRRSAPSDSGDWSFVNVSNVCEILQASCELNYVALKQKCLETVIANKETIGKDKIKSLPASVLVEIIFAM